MRVLGRTLLKVSPSLKTSATAAPYPPATPHNRLYDSLDAVEDVRPFTVQVTAAELPHVLMSDQSAQLVDVREESEWSAGHLKGATHLSRGVLERDIESRFPNHGTRLLFYCDGGGRSILAVKSANEMGYSNVVSISGGWQEIQKANVGAVERAV
eukprot:TRINITY_DN70266_c0_g1_i1.p1 TRINITY_DN70266_c0_g1~~TRINITY_DN70266_c0_g1_i1.p1  ORF type:complete len:155 (-),score=15.43 TRINITY_DN70266_c0_g1_i1:179-643(-)